jgi:hypothetical protein
MQGQSRSDSPVVGQDPGAYHQVACQKRHLPPRPAIIIEQRQHAAQGGQHGATGWLSSCRCVADDPCVECPHGNRHGRGGGVPKREAEVGGLTVAAGFCTPTAELRAGHAALIGLDRGGGRTSHDRLGTSHLGNPDHPERWPCRREGAPPPPQPCSSCTPFQAGDKTHNSTLNSCAPTPLHSHNSAFSRWDRWHSSIESIDSAWPNYTGPWRFSHTVLSSPPHSLATLTDPHCASHLHDCW